MRDIAEKLASAGKESSIFPIMIERDAPVAPAQCGNACRFQRQRIKILGGDVLRHCRHYEGQVP